MTATPADWAAVIAAAEQLAAACEVFRLASAAPDHCPGSAAGAAVVTFADGLLAELASLWAPAGALTSPGTPAGAEPTLATGDRAMADVWPVKFTGEDREKFTAWLERCKQAGAARTMNDAIRLAVELASSIPIEQLPKRRAGHQ